MPMRRANRWPWLLFLAGCAGSWNAAAQVDPIPRELIQFGYNASFEGHAPLAAYAFYLRNAPDFPKTNLTLRLAIAPTYVDSELGVRQILGENTDLGIGLAGGGFADTYDEVRRGTFLPAESFIGHGVESSVSLYHCFNPQDLIPLNGLVRGTMHYSFYSRDEGTASTFVLPPDHGNFTLRSGLRFGGKEPTLYPSLAMELSVWYEGEFRTASGTYGNTSITTPAGDRRLEPVSHLFWEQALLAYTFTNTQQSFLFSVTAGTSVNADRLSTYRLGSLLPLIAEYPLPLPGYFYQEISAEKFVLLGGSYNLPLDRKHHWNLATFGTSAWVDYLDGLEQPGNWHSGVGAGILYQAPSLKVMAGYAYGIEAIRDGHRGASTVGILMQIDLGHARSSLIKTQPGLWRGFQSMFGAILH